MVKEAFVKNFKRISKEKAVKVNQAFKKIVERLKHAENRQKITSAMEIEEADKEVEQCKGELGKYLEYKAMGAKVRSRSQWYEKGERNTKYFNGLEKVKYTNKTLRTLRLSDNAITRNQNKILAEQAKFYQKLYTSNPCIKFTLQNHDGIQYSQKQKNDIDKNFTFEDFTDALKSMKQGKAPGNDGLGPAVYIMFWKRIGPILWDAILHAQKEGILHRSARRGVISLIPKAGRDPLIIKNWRPLMLLNTDHKIVTKMLTNRLKPCLVGL